MALEIHNSGRRFRAPTEDEWHEIWLAHPAEEPGFTQEQSSRTYTSRGLDARNARLAGTRGIVSLVGPDSRIRGGGKGRTIDLVRSWTDDLQNRPFELAQAQIMDDLPRGRQRRLAMLAIRQGQSPFRRQLITAYRGRCAISDCDVEEVLQAAHIEPYDGPATNKTSNGLLLRADLHNLFDASLLWIESGYRVRIAAQLRGGHYDEFDGRRLSLPDRPSDQPSVAALIARRRFGSVAA
ncbi:HNH endonuclease [Actinoplanes sp. NPDC051633]|uniref:HNH endonuclease n=1 Tax=Actinoplanes sp. NPDC051633 TaxID=3155670 RepID=UPI003418CA01